MRRALILAGAMLLAPAASLAETEDHAKWYDVDCAGKGPTYDIYTGWGGADLTVDARWDRYYPERAWRLRQSGWASLRCQAGDGRLTACEVTGEGPVDYQFGEAALKMAKNVPAPPGMEPGLIDLRVDYHITGHLVCWGRDCGPACGAAARGGEWLDDPARKRP